MAREGGVGAEGGARGVAVEVSGRRGHRQRERKVSKWMILHQGCTRVDTHVCVFETIFNRCMMVTAQGLDQAGIGWLADTKEE